MTQFQDLFKNHSEVLLLFIFIKPGLYRIINVLVYIAADPEQ